MSTILAQEPLAALRDKLSAKPSIAIICHQNPDGDAIGSILGLGLALQKAGQQVTMVMPNRPPKFLHWLPHFDEILDFETQTELVTKHISEAEVLFCLDFNAANRVGNAADLVANHPYKVLVDHHEEPAPGWNISFSYPKWSSTCELVYDLLEGLQLLDTLNTDIATCIYTGIMTDTGSFRYSATTPRTHRVAANLLSLGVDPSVIQGKVKDSNSEHRMRLWGLALLDRMEIIHDGQLALIPLSLNDLHRFHYKPGDTEGLVNQGLSIDGVRMAMYMAEQDGYVKMSARSTGTLPVNEFMRDYFNGGGHVNAAGGRANAGFAETIAEVKKQSEGFLKANP